MRSRTTDEGFTPISAQFPDSAINRQLQATQNPLKTMEYGGKTVTVSEGLKGVSTAVNEQIARAPLQGKKRPTTFNKIPID